MMGPPVSLLPSIRRDHLPPEGREKQKQSKQPKKQNTKRGKKNKGERFPVPHSGENGDRTLVDASGVSICMPDDLL